MAGLTRLNVRLLEALVARIDALLAKLSDEPELAMKATITRSDALRLCVLRGLEALEDEARAERDLAQLAEERAESPEWVSEDEAARRLAL